MTNLRKLLVFSVFFSPLSLAAAEINFSGFATVAGGVIFDESSKSNGEGRVSYEGYDNDVGFDSKSLLGLQATSDLGDGWGVTTQFLARGAAQRKSPGNADLGSNSWGLDAEWAFLSYDANDNWRFIVGRQRAPFYMFSDFLDVSYAYPWVNPPGGVYSIVFDVIDGVGIMNNSMIGDVDSLVHLTFGRNSDPVFVRGMKAEADYPNFFSASWTLSWEWLTFRTSYSRADMYMDFQDENGGKMSDLFNGWRQAGFNKVADNMEIKGDLAQFAGLALAIDYNDYVLISEVTKIDLGDTFVAEQDSYYVLIGKRFDSLLLHLTYGVDKNTADFSVLDAPSAAAASLAMIPTPNAQQQGMLAGLNELIGGSTQTLRDVQEDSSYYTLGMRWEANDSVSVKVEYTSYENEDPFTGSKLSLFQTALTTVF